MHNRGIHRQLSYDLFTAKYWSFQGLYQLLDINCLIFLGKEKEV